MNTPASDTPWGEPNRTETSWGSGRAAAVTPSPADGNAEADPRAGVGATPRPANPARISRPSSRTDRVQRGIDSLLTLAVLHPRIDDSVAEVDQRVDDDVAARHEQHRRLQDRVVAAEDRVDRVLAEAGNSEDLLDDQRAAEQLAG